MTEENGQTEENAANIVRTTVRMGAALHARFIDYVHERGRGLPPRKRPSMDAIIQEAVEARIAEPGPVPISEKPTAQVIDNPTTQETNSKVTVPEPATNSEQWKPYADIARLSVPERTCFERLWRIMTIGDPATKSAIDKNLERFNLLVDLLHGGASEAPEHADAKKDPRVGEAEGIANRALEDREPGGGGAGGVSRKGGKPLRRGRKGA